MKDLIERLRDWYNTSDECNRKDMIQAADLLERIYSQPVELPEPFTSVRFTITDPKRIQLYTAEQLTKAVQEATARALEAAAKCVENSDDLMAEFHANAIRNLIGRVK